MNDFCITKFHLFFIFFFKLVIKQGAESRTLFVLGSKRHSIQDLTTYFSKFGTVEHIGQPKNKDGTPHNYCFIRYTSPGMAAAAFQRGQFISGSDQRQHNIGNGIVKVSVRIQTEVSNLVIFLKLPCLN